MTLNTKANFAPLMDDQNVDICDEEDNISQPTIISCPWSIENTKKRFVTPLGNYPMNGAPKQSYTQKNSLRNSALKSCNEERSRSKSANK